MKLDDASIVFYTGNVTDLASAVTGSLYNDNFGRFIVGAYNGYTLTLIGNPQVRDSANPSLYYNVLHTGNILSYLTLNAASVRAALGLG